MSDSSRAQIASGEEVSWGVIPAIAFTEKRMTGEGLNFNIANIVSNEIRSDRQITDLVQVDAEAAGPVNGELSYGAYDDWLQSALFALGDGAGDWTGAVAVAESDIDAAAGDSSFNTAAGDFLADGVLPGMWLRMGGFTDTTLNTYHKVVTVVALKIVVDGTIATEGAGNAITMANSGLITNGVTEKSFTIEKYFSDKGQYHAFAGCIPASMALNLNVNEILTASFEFLGKDMVRDTSTHGTGAYGAASTNPVMNAVANVASIREAAAELASPIFVRQATVNLANNLRGIKAIANLGNVDIGSGRGQIDGTMQVYFENGTLVDKYINGTETSFDFRVGDSLGNAYMVSMPRIKIVSQEIVAGGIDQDIVLDMEFQAIRHATLDQTIQIDRIAA